MSVFLHLTVLGSYRSKRPNNWALYIDKIYRKQKRIDNVCTLHGQLQYFGLSCGG